MQPPPLIPMLATLVAEPSVSCTSSELDQGNLKVIHHLAEWLESLGFTGEVMPLPDKPGKANLIATRPAAGSAACPARGGLVLAGHTDTVPCDAHLWSQDPFELTERDQRLYGLGSCDMKGFFAITIEALRELDLDRLKRPVTVVATADEETSMAGARHLLQSGRPAADLAVIGEPTSMRPIYAHKGFTMLRIRLEGASGHSSNPALGRNALDAMHAVLGELLSFRGELAREYRNAAFEVPVPTLNLGCLHAGDNPNRICGHAELQIDLRMLPAMEDGEVRERLHARLEPVARAHGTPLSLTAINPPVPPFQTPREGALVRRLERLSGRDAAAVAFSTEGPFLQRLGMETVIFGAGDIAQAHQPDEYLALDQLSPTIDVIRRLVTECCLQEMPLRSV